MKLSVRVSLEQNRMWMDDARSASAVGGAVVPPWAILSMEKLSTPGRCNTVAPGSWTKGYAGMTETNETAPKTSQARETDKRQPRRRQEILEHRVVRFLNAPAGAAAFGRGGQNLCQC